MSTVVKGQSPKLRSPIATNTHHNIIISLTCTFSWEGITYIINARVLLGNAQQKTIETSLRFAVHNLPENQVLLAVRAWALILPVQPSHVRTLAPVHAAALHCTVRTYIYTRMHYVMWHVTYCWICTSYPLWVCHIDQGVVFCSTMASGGLQTFVNKVKSHAREFADSLTPVLKVEWRHETREV